jgi:hypothetical protein
MNLENSCLIFESDPVAMTTVTETTKDESEKKRFSVFIEDEKCEQIIKEEKENKEGDMSFTHLDEDGDEDEEEKELKQDLEFLTTPVVQDIILYIPLDSGVKLPISLTPSEFRDLVIMTTADWIILTKENDRQLRADLKEFIRMVIQKFAYEKEKNEMPLTLTGRLILTVLLKQNMVKSQQFIKLMDIKYESLKEYLPKLHDVFLTLFHKVFECKRITEARKKIKSHLSSSVSGEWSTVNTEIWRLHLRTVLFIFSSLLNVPYDYSFSKTDLPYSMTEEHYEKLETMCRQVLERYQKDKISFKNLTNLLSMIHGMVESKVSDL